MPELPEVETIKRVLEPQLKGLTIKKVTVNRPEVTAYPTADEFCKRLIGQKICGMMRRGKFLGILLDSGDRMILHLRMTGCLLFAPSEFPEEKHTHIILKMSDERELRFSDTRRFGRFWLLRKEEDDTYSGISKLGIEPFDREFTADYLNRCFGKRKKTIKECLLDQNMIAGIGNIYSDEILFMSKIHPARRANSLQYKDWEILEHVIPERLSYFITKNEITAQKYLETKGRDYQNTPFLQVYGQEGKSCPVCGNLLCRMVIGGRSSVYCPECQKE